MNKCVDEFKKKLYLLEIESLDLDWRAVSGFSSKFFDYHKIVRISFQRGRLLDGLFAMELVCLEKMRRIANVAWTFWP